MSTISHSIPAAVRTASVSVARRLRLSYLVLAFLFLILVTAVHVRYSYKGFTTGMYRQMRYSSFGENRNLWFLIGYWLEYMQLLKLDESTGFYSFDNVDESRMDQFERGRLEYHRGNFAGAISLIEKNIEQNGESESKLLWLAISHMRYGEAENCLSQLTQAGDMVHNQIAQEDNNNHLQELCALPLVRFHDRAESARTAAKIFEKLLDKYDGKNRLYQWLLNFNYMTAGGFPQEVPPKYLINSKFMDSFYGEGKTAMEKEYAYLSFTDRAREFGVDTFNAGKGVAVEDFDRDGYLDIVTGGNFDLVKFYKNDHGKRFIDRTEAAGLGGIKQPFIITAADYDNDGWMDIFIGRPFGNYALYHNQGDGTFKDFTAETGLLAAKPPGDIAATWVAAWSDVDNDGDLDLFLAQWGFKMPFVSGLMSKPRMDSTLLINEGGHFVDRTREYGLIPTVEDNYFIGAAFGDYDGDGYQDLFLSSPLRNTSVLLKNIGGKRFEPTNLIPGDEGGFVASFLDFNHDGRLDLFWAGFTDAKTSVEQAVFGEHRDDYRSGQTRIFIQTEQGKFVERTDLFDMPMSTMGSSFGDINNDGCFDFYLGKGTPESWFILPNLMYVGKTESTRCIDKLDNISMLQGFGTVQKGHGIVFADFNNDGAEDIYSSLGGMWPADKWPNQFFVNESRLKNSWVTIRLRGRKMNYYGVGAKIKVTAKNNKNEEIVRYALIDMRTGFGSSPYLAHVGLMDATRIEQVEVYWPASRCTQTYKAELNKLNLLDESDCFHREDTSR